MQFHYKTCTFPLVSMNFLSSEVSVLLFYFCDLWLFFFQLAKTLSCCKNYMIFHWRWSSCDSSIYHSAVSYFIVYNPFSIWKTDEVPEIFTISSIKATKFAYGQAWSRTYVTVEKHEKHVRTHIKYPSVTRYVITFWEKL